MNARNDAAGKRLCWLGHAFGNILPPAFAATIRHSSREVYSAMLGAAHQPRNRNQASRRGHLRCSIRNSATPRRHLSHGRVLEHNTLYDTPDSDFRRARTPAAASHRDACALRAAPRWPSAHRDHVEDARARTHGALSLQAENSNGRWRSRSPKRWPAISARRACVPGFRYEKYRTTFRLPGLHLDLDETPVGVFLELEGAPRAIDRAARSLGFSRTRLHSRAHIGISMPPIAAAAAVFPKICFSTLKIRK